LLTELIPYVPTLSGYQSPYQLHATPFATLNLAQKKNRKEKPIVKWRDMQTTIHGVDDVVVMSSKPSPIEKPPALEQDSDDVELESVEDYKSDAETTSKESGDGLTWLDGPPPKLDNVEQCVFNIADTVDVGSSYLLDLLDSTSTVVWNQPGNHPRAPLPPSSVLMPMAPKDKDWTIW
jgi:hypothetical protein